MGTTTGSSASACGALERWDPRGRGAGRLPRYSTDSLVAFGRSVSGRSYDLDRNSRAVQLSCLGVGMAHVAHLVRWCRRRLCTPPTVNFPYSTLNSPQGFGCSQRVARRPIGHHRVGTTVQPVLLTAVLVMIAISASTARGVNPEYHFAQVGLNKAPNPYGITAHGRDHLGCDVAAWRSPW